MSPGKGKQEFFDYSKNTTIFITEGDSASVLSPKQDR
jgi:hypothetical protein